jgi:AcrR family transcriptional regulator
VIPLGAMAPERALSIAPSTKEQLVRTAERLFALHGVDGVSLRQIGQAAGTTNNSAVQYHFGTKDQLVQAIFEYRLPQLIERRRVLAAQAPAGDLRATVEAHLRPIVELAEGGDSYYLMFLEQLQRYGIEEHPFARLPRSYQASHEEFLGTVALMLPHLPEPVRSVRIMQAMAICLHTSADRERARHHAARVLPLALHISALFDGLIGFLGAPMSDATSSALASSPRAVPPRSVVP